MIPHQALSIQDKVTQWARSRSDILAVALVGSWARGQARPDSDLDLLVLTTAPAVYRQDSNWLAELNLPIAGWGDETYGLAWSRRLELLDDGMVELTFAPLEWAEVAPVDAGTARVIGDGCQILYDPDGRLARLVAKLKRESDGDIVWTS